MTPAREGNVEPNLHRFTRIRSAADIGKLAQIPIKTYYKPDVSGPKQYNVRKLKALKPDSLQLAKTLDSLWMASCSLCVRLGSACSSWGGFMQPAVKGDNYDE